LFIAAFAVGVANVERAGVPAFNLPGGDVEVAPTLKAKRSSLFRICYDDRCQAKGRFSRLGFPLCFTFKAAPRRSARIHILFNVSN
jgi:hypothetical protein